MTDSYSLLTGDCRFHLAQLAAGLARVCVTSPPYYGLRAYGTQAQHWPAMQYVPMSGLPPVLLPEWSGELGNEPTPELYVGHLVAVFREVRRVLADDGTLWLNLGDSYAGSWGNYSGANRGSGQQRPRTTGSAVKDQEIRNGLFRPATATIKSLKPKDLIGIPWRVAMALQADGWYLRQDIIWAKPNPMPESVRDRFTKAHEYVFLLSKSERYYFDQVAIKEVSTGRNPGNQSHKHADKAALDVANNIHLERTKLGLAHIKATDFRRPRSVWTVATRPYRGAHFATFPPKLIEPCVLAGSALNDVVLDPFNGAATTGLVSRQHGRRYIGIDLNPAYIALSETRLTDCSS